MADGDPVATLRHAECSEWAWMRSCDPQEVPRLQSGGAFYAPRRIRTAPSWMPFFTHLQLGLLCRDERVARVCELLAARRVKSSLHLYTPLHGALSHRRRRHLPHPQYRTSPRILGRWRHQATLGYRGYQGALWYQRYWRYWRYRQDQPTLGYRRYQGALWYQRYWRCWRYRQDQPTLGYRRYPQYRPLDPPTGSQLPSHPTRARGCDPTHPPAAPHREGVRAPLLAPPAPEVH